MKYLWNQTRVSEQVKQAADELGHAGNSDDSICSVDSHDVRSVRRSIFGEHLHCLHIRRALTPQTHVHNTS